MRPHQVALRLEAHRGRATALVVHDLLHERERSLSARAFVLAASPIETARILLGSGLDGARHGIGLNFTDHMVCSLVLLEPRPAPGPAGRGPYPGTALFPSLVNVSRATRRPYRGGFSVEVSGPVHLEKLGLERMVGSAELDRWSATQVHVMGEMFGHPGRRVELDPTARDVIGRPVPRLHVAFSSEEQEMAAEMKQVGAAIADAMAVPGSRIIPFLEPLTAGAGHEAGTCRMGADSAAPCLPTGRLRAFSNAWVADASVMPTSGDRHPTLTVLAHAWAVANSVAQALDV